MASYQLYSFATALCLLNLILGATDGLSLPESRRTCVIGAGYSGLGTARYLKEYGEEFTVFEASRHIGGTWRFDPHVGVDDDGISLFTSMYKGLRTNTPLQTMEYPGFPFPEGTPSYPEGSCFYKYLKAFAKKFDLLDHIQVRSLVTSVKWAEDQWNVTYMKTDSRENVTEACDFVVVASGENSLPSWPKYDGMDVFQGTLMHSHDYKEPESFRGRRVLLVGAGASGLDLAMHLSNVTSKLVHSHHLTYNQPRFSDNYTRKPDIKAFTNNGVVFEDDSFEEIDVAIFATGYLLSHPFLDSSTGVTATGKYVLPLYQQIVNIKHPSMGFVGVARKVINRVLGAQGQYIAAVIAGKFELPPQTTMFWSWLDQARAQKTPSIVDINVVGTEMENYFQNLTLEAGVERPPPVLTMMRDFNLKNRLEDLLNYRDYDWTILDDTHYKREYVPRKEYPCPIEDYDFNIGIDDYKKSDKKVELITN